MRLENKHRERAHKAKARVWQAFRDAGLQTHGTPLAAAVHELLNEIEMHGYHTGLAESHERTRSLYVFETRKRDDAEERQ